VIRAATTAWAVAREERGSYRNRSGLRKIVLLRYVFLFDDFKMFSCLEVARLVKSLNGLFALSILMSSIEPQAYVTSSQRAFRQRKEGYIKKLEQQVTEFHSLEDNFKSIQAENYSLREYIIHLQSRLIESQGDYPQPPPNVNLNHPHARHEQQQQQQQHPEHLQQQRHEGAPVAPMAPMNSLQASAARTLAAAGLNSGKHAQEEQSYDSHKRFKDNSDESAAADDLIRSQYDNFHQVPYHMRYEYKYSYPPPPIKYEQAGVGSKNSQ
jgi:uncharacterized protein YciI